MTATLKFLPRSLQVFDANGDGRFSQKEIEQPQFLDVLEREAELNPVVVRNVFSATWEPGEITKARADHRLAAMLQERGMAVPNYLKLLAPGELVIDEPVWGVIHAFLGGNDYHEFAGVMINSATSKYFRSLKLSLQVGLMAQGYSAAETREIIQKLISAKHIVRYRPYATDASTATTLLHERAHHPQQELSDEEVGMLIKEFSKKIGMGEMPEEMAQTEFDSISNIWDLLSVERTLLSAESYARKVFSDPLFNGHLAVYALSFEGSDKRFTNIDLAADLEGESPSTVSVYRKLRERTVALDPSRLDQLQHLTLSPPLARSSKEKKDSFRVMSQACDYTFSASQEYYEAEKALLDFVALMATDPLQSATFLEPYLEHLLHAQGGKFWIDVITYVATPHVTGEKKELLTRFRHQIFGKAKANGLSNEMRAEIERMDKEEGTRRTEMMYNILEITSPTPSIE